MDITDAVDVSGQEKEYHDHFYVVAAAFDPGKNTGVVVLGLDGPAETVDLLHANTVEFCRLGDEDMFTYENVLTRFKPDVILVEDVIIGGRMNRDKFIQIRAFDRTLCISYAYQEANRKSKNITVYRTKPETRKHWSNTPRGLSIHARDAYRHIMSWWVTEGRHGDWRK